MDNEVKWIASVLFVGLVLGACIGFITGISWSVALEVVRVAVCR